MTTKAWFSDYKVTTGEDGEIYVCHDEAGYDPPIEDRDPDSFYAFDLKRTRFQDDD